jgi:hypothetical protein
MSKITIQANDLSGVDEYLNCFSPDMLKNYRKIFLDRDVIFVNFFRKTY